MAKKPGRRGQSRKGKRVSAGAARLKREIDRGAVADKVPGFDPAAAPLATDAESAGVRPPAAAQPATEPSPPGSAERAADPGGTERRRYRMQDRMVWPAIAGLLLIAAAIVAAFFAA